MMIVFSRAAIHHFCNFMELDESKETREERNELVIIDWVKNIYE